LGLLGFETSTSEMPPTPFVVPGHHSFWYTSRSPVKAFVFIERTCEPSPE